MLPPEVLILLVAFLQVSIVGLGAWWAWRKLSRR